MLLVDLIVRLLIVRGRSSQLAGMPKDVRGQPIIVGLRASTPRRSQVTQLIPGQHRRLWSAFASEQPTMHRDARAVQGFFNDLARRVGSVPREAQLPRAIQRQRWSPVNVPLLWGAASVEETVPVLDWLVAGATGMDEAINFHDGMINPVDAVRTGWDSLRTVMRSWEWLRGHGFAALQPSNHISALAQEVLFEDACRNDARVALFEAVFVRLKLHMGRTMAFPKEPRQQAGPQFLRMPVPTVHQVGNSWIQSTSQSVCCDGCPC